MLIIFSLSNTRLRNLRILSQVIYLLISLKIGSKVCPKIKKKLGVKFTQKKLGIKFIKKKYKNWGKNYNYVGSKIIRDKIL